MLLRTYPKTQGDRDFLDGIATSDIRQYADMWGLPKADDVPVYVYVKVGGFRVTEEAFINQNLTFEPLIEDWQQYGSISLTFPPVSFVMNKILDISMSFFLLSVSL